MKEKRNYIMSLVLLICLITALVITHSSVIKMETSSTEQKVTLLRSLDVQEDELEKLVEIEFSKLEGYTSTLTGLFGLLGIISILTIINSGIRHNNVVEFRKNKKE